MVWMGEEEAKNFLGSNITGRLATCGEGQPYITPLNYVYHDDKIYFHCAKSGHKLENIKANEKVCFEVSQVNELVISEKPCSCSTRYTSVVVFGKARLIECSAQKAAVLNALMEAHAEGKKYHIVNEQMADSCAVVEINIDNISGKKNINP
ncbi:pyridoxamine 5'-phosphate oxidase family protein [Dendrosporobacter sp. 1207_IL3150]|uniref:pyridoxamine 5'-phosphate oxidase family protein n=1 Tax=Dendrosporobacter sp. 1207_IL3150 TaxID=3084054 RepID=UPI002FDA1300